MAKPPRIFVITAGGPYPWIIINALSAHFGGVEVALEQPESKACSSNAAPARSAGGRPAVSF
jgi:hypothetical protein